MISYPLTNQVWRPRKVKSRTPTRGIQTNGREFSSMVHMANTSDIGTISMFNNLNLKESPVKRGAKSADGRKR